MMVNTIFIYLKQKSYTRPSMQFKCYRDHLTLKLDLLANADTYFVEKLGH